MDKKINCIIVHGCPGTKESLIDISERTYYKHWIPWIREKLLDMGVPTQTPLMPEPWVPDYEKFKKEFEKYKVDENTILIGHSCGCAFLVRWLGDTKKKIRKLILVAPWKVAGNKEPIDLRTRFYNYSIDETIPSRVQEIVMFTSDNEGPGGPESIKMYNDALGGKLVTLPGRGHFILEHMGTVEFPELLEQVI